MSTIANAKVEHNYNRYNGYFFGCLPKIPTTNKHSNPNTQLNRNILTKLLQP